MNASHLNNRVINLLGTGICIASLLIAIFYMEKVLHLAPCPLCILSRYVIAIMAFIFFVGLIDNQRVVNQHVYTSLNLLFGFVGIAIAGRHMWIQYHPSLTCSIGPVSKTMIGYITKAFAGSSSCAENSWEFLGMTVPEQTLALFIVLTILLAIQFYMNSKRASGNKVSPTLK